MSDDPKPYDLHEERYWLLTQKQQQSAEQAGYRRGLAESKPQSDLGSPESEYERGVQAERARTRDQIADYQKRLLELDPLAHTTYNRGREAMLIELDTWLEATDG